MPEKSTTYRSISAADAIKPKTLGRRLDAKKAFIGYFGLAVNPTKVQ